jgi:hypothetical protein
VICAGVLALLQSVQASDLIRIALLFFMTLFSLIGLLTSLRLKGELEECLAKIEAMSVQARVNDFVALGRLFRASLDAPTTWQRDASEPIFRTFSLSYASHTDNHTDNIRRNPAMFLEVIYERSDHFA